MTARCVLGLVVLCGCSASSEVSTLAGSGEAGFADGVGADAAFNTPLGLDVDEASTVYVADSANHRIRRVSAAGEVSTLAGGEPGFADGPVSDARFNMPVGIVHDGGHGLYIADSQNHVVRFLDLESLLVTTVAGRPGEAGFVDGSLPESRLNIPYDVDLEPGGTVLWVAEKGNHAVRRIDLRVDVVETVAGNGVPGSADGAEAQFQSPTGVAVAEGIAWLTDTGNHTTLCANVG